MIKERPIIFSSPMVKAILEGRKTQTRRVIKCQPVSGFDKTACRINTNPEEPKVWPGIRYHKGLKLWVRETFAIESSCGVAGPEEYPPPFKDGRPIQWHDDPEYGKFWDQCHYRATDPTPELVYEDMEEPGVRWKPSIFMPRWASRITLEVVDVRVERLRDMSEHDAIKEGFSPEGYSLALAFFIKLWNSLYTKKPEYQWKQNPWLWVIKFKKAVEGKGE